MVCETAMVAWRQVCCGQRELDLDALLSGTPAVGVPSGWVTSVGSSVYITAHGPGHSLGLTFLGKL